MENRRSSPRVTLVVVLLGYLTLPLAMSGTTVALPGIGTDLHAVGAPLQWVVTGYFLTASSLMLVAGSLGDLFGRRRLLRYGAAIYAIGSLASAAATNIALLDAARVVSGFGAAGVMGTGGAVLATTFTGAARTRAFAAMGTTAGIGIAVGPTFSGWLVGAMGWRATFVVYAVAGVAILVGTTLIADSRATERPKVDWPGALTFVVGIALVMFGVTRGAQLGWTDPGVLALLGGGVLLIVAFVIIEGRTARPVLDLALARDRRFLAWCIAGTMSAVGFIGTLVHLPTYLQGVNHVSAGSAGVTMLMLTAPVLVIPTLGGWLINHGLAPRVVITVALSFVAGGNAWLTVLHPGISTGELLGPLGMIGIGVGLTMGMVDGQAMGMVAKERVGMASGLLNTVRATSNTMALAVIGSLMIALLSSRVGDASVAEQVAAGHVTGPDSAMLADQFTGVWQTLLWSLAVISAVAAIAVPLMLAPRRQKVTTEAIPVPA
ncbi:MFS transporter [Herbihabitans rhizosphaerae]|uniref:MFS transporter n=1 Tax=Herbihabitans rhizosphaerae TaxID=1872711 RepID=A0A4Q7KGG7_9PSEU|nr:MFS transporter [Herbihabitans rhizosphaerae]RZS34353.1 MFS transporter [Herbihabitans rhizosphaerae]